MDKRKLKELREELGPKPAVAKRLELVVRTITRYESPKYVVPAWYVAALDGLRAIGWKAGPQ